ncbi:Uncharacterised protein [Phocoenobacter uteri]|uniref:Uncharacterized protein n=1 Tax=Phocoenobacter uteri TaxID=146806 RepID=A0A379C8Y4_9PAST|nr:hypothetical protein [Phocoenobacter uteri]MDG6882617.1 hypothetical protein [Phocoenobacter uteri]SUB58780.1 Uncharacterised protein [Phocoenobacter uteri]
MRKILLSQGRLKISQEDNVLTIRQYFLWRFIGTGVIGLMILRALYLRDSNITPYLLLLAFILFVFINIKPAIIELKINRKQRTITEYRERVLFGNFFFMPTLMDYKIINLYVKAEPSARGKGYDVFIASNVKNHLFIRTSFKKAQKVQRIINEFLANVSMGF